MRCFEGLFILDAGCDIGSYFNADKAAVIPRNGAIGAVEPETRRGILKLPCDGAGWLSVGIQQFVVGAEGAWTILTRLQVSWIEPESFSLMSILGALSVLGGAIMVIYAGWKSRA